MPENVQPPPEEESAFEQLRKLRPWSFNEYPPNPLSNVQGTDDDSTEDLLAKTAAALSMIRRVTQAMPGGEGGPFPRPNPQTFKKYTLEELEKKIESSYIMEVLVSHAS